MTERYQCLFSKEAVDQRIGQLASEITSRHAEENPLFVALLRGAAPFATKLMFEMARQAPDFHPELDYMMISTYGQGRTAKEPRIVTDLAPDTDVFGRTVIVIDDVLDKGLTGEFVHRHLEGLGALAVKLCVLIDKHTTRLVPIEADFKAFDADDEWLVGMGMDDADSGHEHLRWLSEIHVIKTEDDPPIKAELLV